MVVIRTYSDEGKSGITLSGRPGLLSLLAAVEAGWADFEAVLVYDVSRWGRFQDIDESAYWEYVCKRAGVAIHYCAEPFLNDGSVSSIIIKSLKRTMADEYSRELSAKVFAGQCRLLDLGFHQGGPPGLGYRRLLVDRNNQPQGMLSRGQTKWLLTGRVVLVPGPEEEQRTVREIYRLFVEERKTQIEIVRHLNSRSIPTGTGRLWRLDHVHHILTNPKYMGTNTFNRTSQKLKQRVVTNPELLWIRKESAFPGLVTKEQFQAAARILATLKRRTDEEMLDALRRLLALKGRLSQSVIDAKHIPMASSCAYRAHFGSLRAAYAKIGYASGWDFTFHDLKRTIRRQLAQFFKEITLHLIECGATVIDDPETSTIQVNGEFTVQIIVARYHHDSRYKSRWRVPTRSLMRCDLTLIARMNESNSKMLDYYLLPRDVLPQKRPYLHFKPSYDLERYRSDTLDCLYQLAERRHFGDSEQPGWLSRLPTVRSS